MKRRIMTGVALVSFGVAGVGLGIYPLANALVLNAKTNAAKASESKVINDVVETVFGRTEQAAKDAIIPSTIIGATGLGIGLLLALAGVAFLTPWAKRFDEPKGYTSTLAAIGLGVVALAPILGIVALPLHVEALYSYDYQRANDFVKISEDFKTVLSDNINVMEANVRSILDEANFADFIQKVSDLKTNPNSVNLSDKNRSDFYENVYTFAAMAYAMIGQTINVNQSTGGKYLEGFDWGTNTVYRDRLDALVARRDALGKGTLTTIESQDVPQIAARTAQWFKEAMQTYRWKYGLQAADEAFVLVLSKLNYVSASTNINLPTFIGNHNLVNGLKYIKNNLPTVDDYYELAKPMANSVGINEFVRVYKPSWVTDPLNYISDQPKQNFTKTDKAWLEAEIARVENDTLNPDGSFVSKAKLFMPYFANESIYLDNRLGIDTIGIGADWIYWILSPNSYVDPKLTAKSPFNEIMDAILKKGANNAKTIATWTQPMSHYFIKTKLSAGFNYLANVVAEVTNVAQSIYA